MLAAPRGSSEAQKTAYDAEHGKEPQSGRDIDYCPVFLVSTGDVQYRETLTNDAIARSCPY